MNVNVLQTVIGDSLVEMFWDLFVFRIEVYIKSYIQADICFIFHNHCSSTESLYLSALQNFVSDIFCTI